MFGLRSRVRNRDSARSADTSINEELPDAARAGDEAALAALVARYWERLERMVSLRMDRRLQGRIDPADVVQETYPALPGKFPQYGGSRLPSFGGCGWKSARSSRTRISPPGESDARRRPGNLAAPPRSQQAALRRIPGRAKRP